MNRTGALFCVCFVSGLLGALAASLVAWLCGKYGLTTLVGVSLRPSLTLAWLYPRLVWGGLWGLLYALLVAAPRMRHGWVRKGLWCSLAPTALQLFYFFPETTSHGRLGLGLGTLTPLFVLACNLVWGFVTGLSARLFLGGR